MDASCRKFNWLLVILYNNNRRHSSLKYLTPMQYYREDPEILLAVREAKIGKAKPIRGKTIC